jgi:hypothetical protein
MARRVAKRAWRMDTLGLTAMIAIPWETRMNPRDGRALRASQMAVARSVMRLYRWDEKTALRWAESYVQCWHPAYVMAAPRSGRRKAPRAYATRGRPGDCRPDLTDLPAPVQGPCARRGDLLLRGYPNIKRAASKRRPCPVHRAADRTRHQHLDGREHSIPALGDTARGLFLD